MNHYKNYFRLNDPVVATTLPEIGRKIEPHLPALLDAFYNYLQQTPTTAKILEGHSIDRLKAAQTTHWLSALHDGVNDAYIERVRRIGDAHERIGLNPAFYIGGYSFIVSHILHLTQKEPARTFPFARKTKPISLLAPEEMDIFSAFFRLIWPYLFLFTKIKPTL